MTLALAGVSTVGSAAIAARTPINGLDQHYRAAPYTPPPATTTAQLTKYFTGEPTDDAARHAGTPTATFADDAPTGELAIQQKPIGVVSQNPDSSNAAYWTGPFAGTIDGPVDFVWWWSTGAAVIKRVPVIVQVWADIGTDTEKNIGEFSTDIDVGPTPVQNVTRVITKGQATENLRIRVQPRYLDSAIDIRANYGAVSTPSHFKIPTTSVTSTKPSTAQLRKTFTPLAVQAVPIGRDAHEPTIGVTRDGTAFMAAAAQDAAVPSQYRTQVMRSSDGGSSWSSVQPTAPVIGTTPPTTVDPYLYVDPTTDRVFSIDLVHGGCSYVIYSDDKGDTWTQAPASCAVAFNDRQTLVAGPPPEGITTSGYPNVVYFCFNQALAASCARSLDGGDTWLPAGQPPFTGTEGDEFCSALHGHLVTDSKGRVFVPRSQCGRIVIAVSDDAAQTWKVHDVTKLMRAADSSLAVAVDDADNLYYVWWDAIEHLPYMAVSRDHGQTWGPPLLVSPPGLQEVNFPAIDASGVGRVAITYPGSTDLTSQRSLRKWNMYVTTSMNALDARPTFTSTTANPLSDPIHRGDCNGKCAAMADFLDVVIAPSGHIWATATDTCVTAACVQATTGGVNVALDGQGVAIRQTSGAGLPVTAGSSGALPSQPTPLPATGASGMLPWLAVAAAVTAAAPRTFRSPSRRRTSSRAIAGRVSIA